MHCFWPFTGGGGIIHVCKRCGVRCPAWLGMRPKIRRDCDQVRKHRDSHEPVYGEERILKHREMLGLPGTLISYQGRCMNCEALMHRLTFVFDDSSMKPLHFETVVFYTNETCRVRTMKRALG